jgi:phage major head subunit gpT-like protein
LKRIFDIGMSRPRPIMEMLFGVESSTRFEEQYQGMGAQGLVPPFDGTVPYHDFDAGYRTDIRNYEFAMGVQVERRLVDDDQFGQIRRRASNMSDSFNNTIETDAANVFINGFTDSGTNRMGASTNGADAVGLLSTAHPYSPANSGTTQANEATLALNIGNLDTTRQAMRNFTDDAGQLLGVNPDMLLVPPELERTATQLVSERAIYEPNSADYDVNMFSGRFRPVVWDRLTDPNAWFLIDSNLMKQHLIWQWRIRPEFSTAEDFDGLTAKFRGYMRYGIGWTDWKWIYGQNPS